MCETDTQFQYLSTAFCVNVQRVHAIVKDDATCGCRMLAYADTVLGMGEQGSPKCH